MKLHPGRKASLILMMIPVVLLGVLLLALLDRSPTEPEPAPDTGPALSDTISAPAEETLPEPEPAPAVKETTATLGAVGDILLHDNVIKSGLTGNGYDYTNIYTWFAPYVSALDYAAADMEGTLCSDEYGYPYAGYPCFNAPDEIVDAAKSAGFDLMLTANNHAYDTILMGFDRTQEVIADRGLDHVGTRLSAEDERWLIRDVGGIQIGMTCYTYSTGYSNAGNFCLNGAPLDGDASARLNAFTYGNLPAFYEQLSGEIDDMEAAGAEAIVVFMHWGDEYKITHNDTQKAMAQQLCDMGVDVIVGNHPHVVQPVELLTTEDGSHGTLCLYSTGNSVSNFFETATFPVHTEDGTLFSFTFARYSDGTVLLEGAEILPTWVWRYQEDGQPRFRIVPLNDDLGSLGLDGETEALCLASRERTEEITAEGLAAANEWFAQRQAEFEAGSR